jgi:hypothetical protein
MNKKVKNAILGRHLNCADLGLNKNGVPKMGLPMMLVFMWLVTICPLFFYKGPQDMTLFIGVAILVVCDIVSTILVYKQIRRGLKTYANVMRQILEKHRALEAAIKECPGYEEHKKSLDQLVQDEDAYLHHLDYVRLQLVACAIAIESGDTPAKRDRMRDLFDAAYAFFGQMIGGSGEDYEPFFLDKRGGRTVLRRMTSYVPLR